MKLGAVTDHPVVGAVASAPPHELHRGSGGPRLGRGGAHRLQPCREVWSTAATGAQFLCAALSHLVCITSSQDTLALFSNRHSSSK
jgi:hypothetical protein